MEKESKKIGCDAHLTANNTLQVDASTVTRYAAQNPRRPRVAPELNRCRLKRYEIYHNYITVVK